MIQLAPTTLHERWLLNSLGSIHSTCWTFELTPSGFTNKQAHSNLSTAMSSASYGATIFHTIDPITAVALGLVSIQDLNAPPGFEALLNMIHK